MPVTRSMKSYSVDNNAAASATTSAPTSTEATPSEHTRSTYATRTTGATTETDATPRTTAIEETNVATVSNEAPVASTSRPRTTPKTTKTVSAKSKRKDLAKAREELLALQVKLAAARVAALEEDDTDIEEDFEESTVREERTTEWIRKSTMALTLEPHHEAADIDTKRECPRDRAEQLAPPQPCDADVQRPPPTSNVMKPINQQEIAMPPEPTEENHAAVPYYGREANTFDYNKLASAITLAARAVQPNIANRHQELPAFNGSSSDWLPFKTAFEESAPLLSEQENLARLRRTLRGAAKEAVQCLFVGATSAYEVMRLLESRFGRPDALALAELNKLRHLPRLTENPKDICTFASKIINVTATVKALKKNHYLYNAEIVRSVVEKLPSALRYRYYDYAAEQPEDTPDLTVLSAFMERTATRCGNFAPAENIASEDRREYATRKPLRSYHAQEPRATSTKPTCAVCKREGHATADCYKMKEADVPTRWEIAKKHRLCFRCLRTRKLQHFCKPKKCDINGCEYLHHELLHGNTPSPPPPKRETETSHTVASTKETELSHIVASAKERKNTTALLKILPVEVEGPKGTCSTYALLDDGSTCSLIEDEIAKKIGATGSPDPFYIEGVAGARIDAQDSRRVKILLRGADRKAHHITARTMKSLQLASQAVTRDVMENCEHLRDLEDCLTYKEASPKILLGQDNWALLLAHDLRLGKKNQPIASLTDLGWVLHGVRETRRKLYHRVHHATIIDEDEEESIEAMMKQHFSLESLAITPRRSYNDDERRALQTLEENTRRLPAGGYETGLLWRQDNPAVPDSYGMALRRLELVEKKLNKNENLKKKYEEQLNTLLSNNYAELATPLTSARKWYLPHFGVINPQKPEKLRIVHDAAAKSRGVSLNDMLLPGPDLLQSLPGVLMRFRQRPIAVSADIKDMFMRVTIREEDRDMQRFLWRNGETDRTPTEYRMKSVIFGATSSPCTAIYVKNKNAEKFKEEYPEAAAAIVDNHYVDDYLASFDTVEEAVRISTQVTKIHEEANYFLQRWASNSTAVLDNIAPGTKGDVLHLDGTKILGMVWQPSEDTLTFNVNEQRIPADVLEGKKTPTKREALRTVMSIFDPLGIATPITIQAKRIMQDVWRSGIEWDTDLQEEQATDWRQWLHEARRLSTLTVPRCYNKLSNARNIQLHTFVDASSSAYAAISYWRVEDRDGDIWVSLVAAKGKVAPLKVVSIPRLELQAAVVGSRLAETIVEEHQFKPASRHFWSDSRTVLTWVRNGPRQYKPFVAHRLAEIGEHTKTKEWRWVPTKLNPADDATRSVPHDFNAEHRWYQGPAFLYYDESEWPRENIDNGEQIDEAEEERVHVINQTTCLLEALPDVRRFSSWTRLIRATARVLQFVRSLRRNKQQCTAATKRNKANADADPTWRKNKEKIKTPVAMETKKQIHRNYVNIEAGDLRAAETLWVRAQQEEVFQEEMNILKKGTSPLAGSSRLSKLAVLLDDSGVIRLRSRIAAAANITEEQKSPAVLDGDHPWTRLYIAWVHRQTHHGGFAITTNEIRQQYWLLRLRVAVRGVLKKCPLCRIRRSTPPQPSTGDHPRSRLAHHQRPFTFTGLDYFGPLQVTVGRGRQKRYGVIFTCLTTRAVHVELAGDLSTDAAIMALRRFIARRGCPTELWSDQGTNLKGADGELQAAATEALQRDASARWIKWRYIPPSAPFMGGAWERLVRSIKTALHAVLHERAPREEVLSTLLVEAEHTLNSRPLTHVSTSPDDEEALTPNHLLLGGPSRVPLPGAFTEDDDNCKKMWRTSQRLADMFWSRWMREYLPELQHRREPRASNGTLQLGDLVFIADGTLPRNCWPRGVITAIYPGPDGEVRAVDVRTTKGVLRRPTKKLVVIVSSGTREP